MDFTYKTESQLDEMTPEQRDVYLTQKRAFEAAQSEMAIKTAVDDAKNEMNTLLDKANQTIDELKQTVEAQGTKITELNKASEESSKGEPVAKIFEKAYKEERGENLSEMQSGKQLKISHKDIASTSVMSVDTVASGTFPAAGSSGVVTSGMYAMWAKFLGFIGLMPAISRIMDLVDVSPLNEARLFVVNTETIGDAAITPECTLKPIVRMTFEDQTVDANPVAAMWFTTSKVRRFFNNVVDMFRKTFADLISRKIPQTVLTAIANNSTAFTPNALFNISTDPNDYDALGAVIAQIQALGYLPNGILIHPTAYRNMKQSKGSDGHYNLANGGSISIVNGGLDWNGTPIPIILDATLSEDEFIVGDFYTTVKVGLDNELIYIETDGRVDSNDASVSGLAKNIRTHVLERFVATIIPNATKALLVKDTFSNVKTLITASSPSV